MLASKEFVSILTARVPKSRRDLNSIVFNLVAVSSVGKMTAEMMSFREQASALYRISAVDEDAKATLGCLADVSSALSEAEEPLTDVIENLIQRSIDSYAALSVADRKLLEGVLTDLANLPGVPVEFMSTVKTLAEVTVDLRKAERKADSKAPSADPVCDCPDCAADRAAEKSNDNDPRNDPELKAFFAKLEALGVDVKVIDIT